MTQQPATRLTAIAPGRVNLLGEHVDYNAGPVLPAAIDRSVRVSAITASESLVSLKATDLDQVTVFDLNQLEQHVDLNGMPLPKWASYPAGVAWALQQAGFEVRPISAEYRSSIPIGAGLSSSAAVELAFAVAWQAAGGWETSPFQLAQICQKAENQYVGVNSGLMDQFASAMGIRGHALYFDTRSLYWEAVPLPESCALVIADSGVRRNLAASAYNQRRKDCETAVSLLKQRLPAIQALRDVAPEQFSQAASLLPEPVRRHARHVVEECARVDQAVLLLKAGDTAGFGRLMVAGHASLRDLYEVSTPELDRLVGIACELPGCWGARLTGAGFGGCTVNLVERTRAQEFMEALQEKYADATGRKTQVYLCQASQGAHLEEVG